MKLNEDTEMKYSIGDQVIDENGKKGVVVIIWNDGDIWTYENDVVHPNPKIVKDAEDK